MSRTIVRITGALVLLALLLTPLAAWAHETVVAGDYAIEYGWVNEPPVAGRANGLIINISQKSGEAHVDTTTGTISLVAPTDGGTVQGDRLDVVIKVEGVDEHDADSMHWHLYVDDHTLAMAPLSQSMVTVAGLGNGDHTIRAVMAMADHDEVGQAAQAKITVEGSSANGQPSAMGGLPTATPDSHQEAAADLHLDVSALKLELVYGGQTTPLTLKPKQGGDPGQYVADFTPERAGLYTLRLSGRLSGDLGATDVNAEVQPEEVAPAPAPSAGEQTQDAPANITLWLVIGGVVILAAVGVFVFINRKK